MYPENPAVPQYDKRRHGYLRPICETCSGYDPNEYQIPHILLRLRDLEDMVELPGSIPRQFNHQLQQLQGKMRYLEMKVATKGKHKDKL